MPIEDILASHPDTTFGKSVEERVDQATDEEGRVKIQVGEVTAEEMQLLLMLTQTFLLIYIAWKL